MTGSRDEWMFRLSLATAATTLISISAAQVLLALTLVVWVLTRSGWPRMPGYALPLGAFALATLVSLAMSADPSVGFGPVRKFVLFSMGFLASTFVDSGRRARVALQVMVLAASVTSVTGIVQFGLQYLEFQATGSLLDDPTVLARATGFMGHWMTFSGEQMLVWSATLVPIVALGPGFLRAGAVLIGASLVLSFTRSVWVGATVSLATSIAYLPFRQIARLLVPLVLVAVVASGLVGHRIAMSFAEGTFVPDTGRIEMAGVGLRMIADHPLFGVGPERVVAEFPAYYRGDHIEDLYTGHLHNNFLQIAAERGLIALAAFIWLFVRIGVDMVRGARGADGIGKWTSVSGLCLMLALLTAGLFEYNFGDSEVLMVFLFLVSIPYGVAGARDGGTGSGGAR